MSYFDNILQLAVKPTLDDSLWSSRQVFLEFSPVLAVLHYEFADNKIFFDREVRAINVGPQVVQTALSYLFGSEIYIDR